MKISRLILTAALLTTGPSLRAQESMPSFGERAVPAIAARMGSELGVHFMELGMWKAFVHPDPSYYFYKDGYDYRKKRRTHEWGLVSQNGDFSYTIMDGDSGPAHWTKKHLDTMRLVAATANEVLGKPVSAAPESSHGFEILKMNLIPDLCAADSAEDGMEKIIKNLRQKTSDKSWIYTMAIRDEPLPCPLRDGLISFQRSGPQKGGHIIYYSTSSGWSLHEAFPVWGLTILAKGELSASWLNENGNNNKNETVPEPVRARAFQIREVLRRVLARSAPAGVR